MPVDLKMASDVKQWLLLPHVDNEASRRGIQQWRLDIAGDLSVVTQHGGEHHAGETEGHGKGKGGPVRCTEYVHMPYLGVECLMPPGNGATRTATCACGVGEQDVVMAARWDPQTRLDL